MKPEINIIFLLCIMVVINSNAVNPQKSTAFNSKMKKLLVQNECAIPPKQTKVAIWTMTHLRIGKKGLQDAITFFNNYLKLYAESQCDAFDSIYLIWNNDQNPEFYGFTKNKANWKKKVHFLHTEENSLDFRYIVPQWVEQDVLLNLDDDAVITCDGIKNSLKQYNERSIGGFGPIGGTLGRVVNYNKSSDAFQNPQVGGYGHKTIHNYVLPGLAILSKHTAELYYSQIFEFRKIREITQKLMNCEDIAANFMTNSLYDDVLSFFVKNMSGVLLPSNFQLHHHEQFQNERKRCGYWFAKIFGQNPNEYVYEIDSYPLKENRTRPVQNNPCLTLVKKGTIENRYFTHENYFLNLKGIYAYGVSEQLQKVIENHNKVMQLQYQQKKKLIDNNMVEIKYHSKNTLQSLFKFVNQTDSQGSLIEQILKPVLPLILQQKLREHEQKLQKLNNEKILKSVERMSRQIQDINSNTLKLKLMAVLQLVFILAILLKIVNDVIRRKKNNSVKLQSYEIQQLTQI